MVAPITAPQAATSKEQSDANREKADELVRQFDKIAAKRGTWEVHWEEIAQYVLPHYSTSFYTQGNTTPGQKRNERMFDVTAAGALNKFAAAMESMLTPRSSKWHRVQATNADLMKMPEVSRWFDQVNNALFHYRYSPAANYASQQHEAYINIGAFGTTTLFTDQNAYGPGLRYRHVPLGELFFMENHQGQVDKVFRRFKMTARQAVQKWGMDGVPEAVRNKAKMTPEEESWFLHVVCPREDWSPWRMDVKGKRYCSYYIHKDSRFLLSEGGYSTIPYNVTRYMLAPGETFGRSPAMTVLPGIKVLNEQKKTLLKQGHRAVDPVLLAHDDGIMDGFTLKPGAVNFGAVTADGRPLVHPLATGTVQVGKELMDDERAAINDAFLVTLFQILVETPQMTATEVLERAREKGALLSPTMGRYQSEGLGVLIQREFDLLAQQNLLPPIPQVLMEARGEYKIEYDSPLSRAMRAEEASGMMRMVQYASEIAAQTQDPSIMDNFNFDEALPAMADISSVPPRWMSTPDEIAAKRQARQQAQAVQQITQALPGMAAMAKAAAPQGSMPNAGQPAGGGA